MYGVSQAGRSGNRVGCFPGHLRVRDASAVEIRGIAGLFPEPHRGWVMETVATDRARILVVERFAEGAWGSLGYTVTDAGGQTALVLRPEDRGRGLAHEVLKAAIGVLREEPFAELTACLDPGAAGLARILEMSGFTPDGTCLFGGRLSARYIRNLRGDCTPYNVWI